MSSRLSWIPGEGQTRMTAGTAETERQAFLAGFLPAPEARADWDAVAAGAEAYPRLAAELWTARQRQAANLH